MFKKYFLLAFIVCALGFSFNNVQADENPPANLDTTPPIITLLGNNSVTINVGDNYVDAGATAIDDIDGDITTKIVVNNTVNTASAGNYTVGYNVSDAAGNLATEVVRNVVVQAPVSISKETFIIRNGEQVIWSGEVNLLDSGTVSVPDSNNVSHSINSQSVLGLLYTISQTSQAFSLSNLQYYSSFNSFYLKCLTPVGGADLCDNWQYVVGDITPWQSIENSILSGDNTVGIYFGSSHRLNISTNSVLINNDFTVKAEKYNYLNNSWTNLTGVSVGVTLPNPKDPWNPKVILTKPVDNNGQAVFSLSEPNDYNLGIVEDYYFPSYFLKAISSTDVGSSTNLQTSKKVFDVNQALDFLRKHQSIDGSFLQADLYTDWVAIAYGAAEIKDASYDKLLSYFNQTSKLANSLTDNERRAMALLALQQNPYNFNNLNYIQAIVDQFDGQQFGDNNLVNDDIFALIPLLKSGYTKDDEIISKDLDFILSKQDKDGSWNQSIDLTAACLQLLSLFKDDDQYKPAINQAEEYVLNNQKADGGFGSIYSTSWAAQAMKSLDKSWLKNNNSPIDNLNNNQAEDGSAIVLDQTLSNKVWATSYVLPAILNKDWFSILKQCSRPAEVIKEDQVINPSVEQVNQEKAPIKLVSLSEPVKKDVLSNRSLSEKPSFVGSQEIKTTSSVGSPEITNLEAKPNQANSKNILILVTSGFVIIGGFFVARFWL